MSISPLWVGQVQGMREGISQAGRGAGDNEIAGALGVIEPNWAVLFCKLRLQELASHSTYLPNPGDLPVTAQKSEFQS